SKPPISGAKNLGKAPLVCLSKSTEKAFLRMKKKLFRSNYVEAELVNGVASQIRVMRQQRRWTQNQLARQLKTSQAVVSRLEDPSYGKFSIKTLLDLANVM